MPRNIKWHFKPLVNKGTRVSEGDIIGEVQETPLIVHKVMVPPGVQGRVTWIEEGDYSVDEPITSIEHDENVYDVKMMHEWPVRTPRPFKERLPSEAPLIVGLRVIDTFFPIAKGGAAAIPGASGQGRQLHCTKLPCTATLR